jgi:hypothetical protein
MSFSDFGVDDFHQHDYDAGDLHDSTYGHDETSDGGHDSSIDSTHHDVDDSSHDSAYDSFDPLTQGMLEHTDSLMAGAHHDAQHIAADHGLHADLSPSALDSANGFIDAVSNASPDQLRHIAGFEQGDTFAQNVANSNAKHWQERLDTDDFYNTMHKTDNVEIEANQLINDTDRLLND